MSTGIQNPNFQNSGAQKSTAIWLDSSGAADEGSYFVITNPTVGTAIAMTTSVVDDAATASSTHAQYSPVMVVQNQWSASDPAQKIVAMQYLKMLISQVPSSATTWQYAIRLDPNPVKITTAGTSIVPVNSNSNSGTTSKTLVAFGANVTAIASTASRLVARGMINSAVPVTLDQWYFNFGGNTISMDQISGGTGAKNISSPCPPIIIAPGWTMTLEMWGASNAAAPSWEFEGAFVERPAGQ